MDLDSAAYRLSSPSGGGGGGIGELPYSSSSGANHRRSSFTEYRSLLSSALSGDRTTPTTAHTTAAGATTRSSYLSGLRDDPFYSTATTTTTAPSKYSSTLINSTGSLTTSAPYDKYTTSSIHLDDNNNNNNNNNLHSHHHHNSSSYQDHSQASKYTSYLDDSISNHHLTGGGAPRPHHLSSATNANAITNSTNTNAANTTTTTSTSAITSSSLFNPTTTSISTSSISGLPAPSKYTSVSGGGYTLDRLHQRTTNAAEPSITIRDGVIGSSSLTATSAAAAAKQQATADLSASSLKQLIDDEMAQIHETVDSIEIPARGRCKVFMAKYGYDPFKQSPNDNPDAELAFNAGDYIMVFDDIDEDGYFIGELMDGRRGYVPSNWLYRLTGDDLFEFQASVLYKQAGGGGGAGGTGGGPFDSGQEHLDAVGPAVGHIPLKSSHTTFAINNTTLGELGGPLADDDRLTLVDNNSCYPPEFYDALISDTMNHSNFQHLLAPEDYHRMNDYVDLDDVNEVDDECLSDYERAEAEQMRRAVPPPQRLVLERQLNKCILIAWLHPQAAKGTIVSYQVYVDGVLKATVPSGDRTKALLDGVDTNIPHRISVRAIDLHGRHSNDAGCTIVIGQKIPFAPSCVKASHITSDSALISWLPCNSNFHHVVAVNSVEVQTVRPGVYKHLINGLSANTLYRVWVRAKPGKILSIDEKNPKKLESLTTYVDFKTMPKSLPDPPVNVQVEAGPQRRTLLVTWLPLTLNDYGSSNGVAVTGYAVFAGHKKLAEIDSPTGDHALLDIGDLESLHKKSVTVRTKSGENLSQDSMPCQIPDEYLKTAAGSRSDGQTTATTNSIGHHHQHGATGGGHHGGHHQGASAHHPHHVMSSTSMSQSPSRQRMPLVGGGHPPGQRTGRYPTGGLQQQHQHHSGSRASRALTRSMHNLESDLESRRSSIPAIEITRETSGSEMMNQTESYSEEEFESSMRFKGAGSHRGRMASGRTSGGAGGGPHHRGFRARQSHSVDGQYHHPGAAGQQQFMTNRQLQSQAANSQQRFRGPNTTATNALVPGSGAQTGEIRFFVALFDYDPSTMSPNPNAAAEELAFKEGSIIKVYGGLGEDGFYKGELVDSRASGYVPCNVITEITDPNLLASLFEKSQMSSGGVLPIVPNHQLTRQQQQQQQLQQPGMLHNQQLDQMQLQQQQQQQQPQTVAQPQTSGGGAVKRMVALYDYDPQENSPNADTESEIPFKTGDIIFVYGKMDTDGFYMGEVERTKQRGLVPSNFLREEPLLINKQQQQLMMQQPTMDNQQNQMMQQAMQQQQQTGQAMGQPMGGQFAVGQQQLGNAGFQQQQQLRNNQANMMRGGAPIGAGGMGQQQQPQNINRPNSLSLGAQNTNQQQQQQQQQQQMLMQMQQNGMVPSIQQQQAMLQQQQQQMPNTNMPNQFMAGGNMLGRPGVAGPNMMMNNPQQQQQQQALNNTSQQSGTSGVLSNLLSSGKQIIGAATTPRVPMQPGAFTGPMMNVQQQPNQQGGQMMGSNLVNVGQQQHTGQSMMMNTGNQMQMDNSGLGGGGNFGMANRANPQQQQQAQSAMGAFNQHQPGHMDTGQQQQHQQQLHNQQQQPYNQMGGGGGNFAGRAGGMSGSGALSMNQMGEEQGGNILNTVKNMFKL